MILNSKVTHHFDMELSEEECNNIKSTYQLCMQIDNLICKSTNGNADLASFINGDPYNGNIIYFLADLFSGQKEFKSIIKEFLDDYIFRDDYLDD